jgi:glycolate oxidase iron-sulfur subunit
MDTQTIVAAAEPARPAAKRTFTPPDVPPPAVLDNCVHCGLCLPNCPTYRELSREPSSPRGRIHLIRAVAEGRVALDAPLFREQMYQCLDCRACEAVCPSGVQYGKLVEAARAQIERAVPRPLPQRLLRWAVFTGLFASPLRFRAFAHLLGLYQHLGLQQVVRRTGLLRWLGLAERERMLPSIARRFLIPRGQEWRPSGPERGRVALFAGCVMSTAYADVDRATIRVLLANGYRVVAPAGQGCCGALHVHAGLLDAGRALMRRNVAAFAKEPVDAIIVNAAGCGAALKEYDYLLSQQDGLAEQAHAVASRVRDISEFLVEQGWTPPAGRLEITATYQEPCHLTHAQRIKTQPRALLRSIPGLRLVEMAEADLCCGSAGIYNLTHPELSGALRRRKIANILATGAEVVVSANPGCMLQLQAGLAEAGRPLPVRHVVELLDAAYRAGRRAPSA